MPLLRFSLLFAGLFAGALLALDAPKGKKYALLIAVKDYDSERLAPLKFPENDIEEFAKLLQRKNGFDHVRILTSSRGKKKADAPTSANVRAALKELLRGKTRHDTVLIALAGHGIQLSVSDPKGKGKEKTFPCFCPSDAQTNDTDYETGKSPTLFNLNDMVEDLGNCSAGAKLVLIDACRNEVQARNVDVGRVLVPENVMALFSCKSGQRAFETPKLGKGHGVFFHFVLEALRGEAKDRDGDVTWDAMTTYVRKHVSPWVEKEIGDGAKQTPHSLNNVAGVPVVLMPSGAAATRQTVKNSVGMELVEIPAGEFDMGAPSDEKGGKLMERPSHKVRLTKSYFLGTTEVTQGQYRQVMGVNPSAFAAGGERAEDVAGKNTDRHPVENISHADAVAFCKKLTQLAAEKKAKRTYRLPTEAEWEYACRAGTNTAFHTGDKLSVSDANFLSDKGRTIPVSSHKPNRWGLNDIHGNVREWVADWYASGYYEASAKDDPKGPEKGIRKLTRGGSWADPATECRSAFRALEDPVKVKNSMIGFRVVMEAK